MYLCGTFERIVLYAPNCTLLCIAVKHCTFGPHDELVFVDLCVGPVKHREGMAWIQRAKLLEHIVRLLLYRRPNSAGVVEGFQEALGQLGLEISLGG